MVNAQALNSSSRRSKPEPSAAGAKKWWLGELGLAQQRQRGRAADLPIDAGGVARIEALVAEGTLNDKMARQVIDGILAGRVRLTRQSRLCGLALVSDDTALLVAVDEAIAGNPDVAQKVRDGKVAAVGALVAR